MKETRIQTLGLSKIFRLYKSRLDRIRELLHPTRKKFHNDFYALKEIDLTVSAGESIGIIGRNGSGKSTLLKIIAGVMTQSAGTVSISGRIASLLELGAGFHPELNAVENLYLHGLLRGIPRSQTKKKLDSILDFSGIGPYAHQPVKSYSSGMFVRLAFSAEVHTIPEIFIVDEALGVGDASFQMKSMRRMRELQEQGTTIAFVSHDASTVRSLCTRAILLDKGRIVAEGSPAQVYDIYSGMIGFADEAVEANASFAERSGSGELRFAEAWIENSSGKRADTFRSGEGARIVLEIEASETIENPTIGIHFRDASSHELFGINTALLGIDTGIFVSGQKRRVAFTMPLDFGPGLCTLGTSIHQFEIHTGSCYDWVNHAITLRIEPDPSYRFSGSARLRASFLSSVS
ncbi:MAG TPA: ABC transporter ATP-binding protein [Leptospiraceae bacterium]|nr:ABC transporter ATP-binding protein [Leptospirales bacterium]HMY44560.1 ABC transporter ATP-binding protein [Leptospiraceae bacterium]HNL00348.1 ABC transporter ATP-binding protein [Leptospiraceae bacterium]HNN57979.1 ABC transporter ATP-binding protein [Leptospiraceae bacterium]